MIRLFTRIFGLGDKVFAKLSKVLFCFAVLLFTSAFVDRTVTIKGQLQTLEKDFATVKTESGVVKVPASALRDDGFRPGQSVITYVDVGDLIALNRKFFEALDKASGER